MFQKLYIALLQAPLVWENAVANRTYFYKIIQELPSDIDLIVLPEMFTTGFTENAAENAETMNGETIQFLKKISKEIRCAITGSIIIQEGEYFYNRLLFVTDGTVSFYDKRHLFSYGNEDKNYHYGSKKLLVNVKGWKICPFICYDLRFPVWSRNVENYDLLLYVANWPGARIDAWDTLLKARAIENMAYVAGVNRLGEDGNGIDYPGYSIVYDVLGNAMTEEKNTNESVIYASLDKKFLEETRKNFMFLNDMDRFSIEF